MPKRNRLLASLPEETFQSLRPYMEIRHLGRGDVLHRPGETIEYLYFPIDCVISITITARDGKTAEAGAAGSREMVGINAFMGGRETTQTGYIVQVPGDAVRIPAEPLKRQFDTSKEVRNVLLRYTQVLIAHLSQNVACNRLHVLDQRFARWLLEVHDRIGSNELRLTHEFIAEMVGVLRPRVTEVIGQFQAAEIIQHKRKSISIVDVERLKDASCGCYEIVTAEYERLLGPAMKSL